MSNSYGCDNLDISVVISNLSFSVLCTIVSTTLTIYCIYKLFNNKKIKKHIYCLCVLSLITLSLECTFILICLILFQQCPAQRESNLLYLASAGLYVLMVLSSLVLIHGLFIARVINTFDKTMISIRGKTKKVLYFGAIIQGILFILNIISGIIHTTATDPKIEQTARSCGIVLASVFTILYLVNFISALVIFVQKLTIFSQFIDDSDNNNSNSKNKDIDANKRKATTIAIKTKTTQTQVKIGTESDVSVMQKRLYALISRMVVCCTWAIGSTLLSLIMFTILYSQFTDSILGLSLLYHIYSLDATINCLSLMLQWKFSTGIYYKICNVCDKRGKQLAVSDNGSTLSLNQTTFADNNDLTVSDTSS